MPGDHFWLCVEALASTFSDRKTFEENLSIYEKHALAFSPERRAKVRGDLVEIIAGLSRLARRLAEADGG